MKPRMRWFLYSVALILTLIALALTGSDDQSKVVAPVAVNAAREPGRESTREPVRPPLVVANQSAPKGALDLERLSRADHGRPAGDPFRPRNWFEVKVAPPPPAQPVQPPPPPPPEAPPLPFTFIGRLTEHGRTVVYLNLQDRIASGGVGDTIDRRYRIEAIDDRAITFTYLPLDIRQQLALPGRANPGETGSASPAVPSRSVTAARPRRGSEEDDD